ncbi:MAG: hypothetical protein FWF27_04055 [Candidatus Bathyarchaeota archaeon]|nr:hypothetical protein [Candidatus Termiticorpusculum sp.]
MAKKRIEGSAVIDIWTQTQSIENVLPLVKPLPKACAGELQEKTKGDPLDMK